MILMVVDDEPAVENYSRHMINIMRYIENHYTHDLSLEQIAQHVHLHPNYISALFRKEMGFNFIYYLHTKRIDKAKELMSIHPHLSFNRISEKVGFENVRHFFNVFKRYSGMTPGKYRESRLCVSGCGR